MKNSIKKILLWRYKGLLSMALSGLTMVAHAQGVDVCTGTAYTIVNTVKAAGAATYQWLENGQIIPGASAATYTVPSNKAAGFYAYIRQAKSVDCPDWQPSNEFVVTVFACSFTAGATTGAAATFTDPRDGKNYKTVVLPDGKTWFAQNLNYTKDMTYNAYSYEANGKQFTSMANGVPAVGSYWCPAIAGSIVSGSEADCNTYGALYTWETAMMVDGKYAEEAKTSSAWDESWVSGNYFTSGAPGATANADKNNARGGTSVKGGGRGICPMGWHIPTESEWATMLDKVEGNGSGSTYTNQPSTGWWGVDAGKKLKSAATYTGVDPGNGSWQDDVNRGNNAAGFDAVPAGHRTNNGSRFYYRGTFVDYWCSSVGDGTYAWYRYFGYSQAQVIRNINNRSFGFSVRCIKD
jgi:uncharacterized protein (TIGR02145 family)